MTRCEACGYQGEGDGPAHAYMSFSPACWARYGEILAREFSDAAYYRSHRLLTDACCGQHSIGDDRRARQSLHIHLAALLLHFEDRVSADVIVDFLRRAAREKQFARLEQPAQSAVVTLDEVYGACDARQHGVAVERYGRAVYEAWRPHHHVFRALIEKVG